MSINKDNQVVEAGDLIVGDHGVCQYTQISGGRHKLIVLKSGKRITDIEITGFDNTFGEIKKILYDAYNDANWLMSKLYKSNKYDITITLHEI